MNRGAIAVAVAMGVLVATAAPPARAHELRPGLLSLTETAPGQFDVVWKLPRLARAPAAVLEPAFPAGTTTTGARRRIELPDAVVESWQIARPGGLAGESLRIPGLAATETDVLVRLQLADGRLVTHRLVPADPRFVVPARATAGAVGWTYLVLGIEHILIGIDHLLFVLGLLLLTGAGWKLVKTITAFTAAHSITLAAATLGLVSLPQAAVEAVIALSIVFVAREILSVRAGRPGLTASRPWLVAFTFGLLHGFGFAGALREVGLPAGDIPMALLAFNLGVEVGQLLFVAAVALVGRALARLAARLPAWTGALPAYTIGGLAGFWCIERVAAML